MTTTVLTKSQTIAVWKAIKTLNRNIAIAEEGERMNVSDMENILDMLTDAFPNLESMKKSDL